MPIALIQYLKRFCIHLVLLVLVVLFIIAGIRVYLITDTIDKAQTRRPLEAYRVQAAANWSYHYPVLRVKLLDAYPDARHTSRLRPSPLEQMLLAIPDWTINQVLAATYSDNRGTASPDDVRPAGPEPRTPPTQVPATATGPGTSTAPAVAAVDTGNAADPTTASSNTAPAPPPTTPPAREETAEQPEVAVDEPDDEPAYDPDAYWAVVHAPDAGYYDRKGTRLGVIPPGSVLDIHEYRPTNKGMVVRCTAHTPDGRRNNIYIREQDLRVFQGQTLQNSSIEQRRYAFKYAQIKAAITKRRKHLENGVHADNPHQAAYIQRLRAYQSLREESDQLQAAYDQQTGAERVRTGERLHEIRVEAAAMVPDINGLRKKRNAWNEQRGPLPSPDEDFELQNLQQQLQELEQDAPDGMG